MNTSRNGRHADERALAVAIDGWRVTGEELEEELRELGHLASTAGARMERIVLQERSNPDPGTMVGSGKLQEIKRIAEDGEFDMVLFNDNLKPAQYNKIQEELDRKVLDRTDLILDIFAQRAQTKDAKMQVELAQLQHTLPRTKGWGIALTRQAGGIGTRGPGETKMEIQERDLRQRITRLKDNLEEVRSKRKTQRKNRQGIPEVSLVGYTNAGKSTLLNTLSDSDARQEDQLFATLDTKTRRVHLEGDRYFLLTDTVGLIQRMPPKLMEAFKATLEELGRADLILILSDLSSPRLDDKMETVQSILEQLEMEEKPRFHVFNKIDRVDEDRLRRYRNRFPEAYFVSAREGTGLVELKEDLYRFFLDNGLLRRPDYAETLPLKGSVTA